MYYRSAEIKAGLSADKEKDEPEVKQIEDWRMSGHK
jgi:hypothetical protein